MRDLAGDWHPFFQYRTAGQRASRSVLGCLQARTGQAHRLVEFAFQFLPRQRIGPVAGHMDSALLKLKQRDVFLAFARAKDHAQRCDLVRLASIPLEPAQIELHLAFIGRFELAELQLNRDQAAEFAVIEQQVEVVIAVVDLHPLLAGHEAAPPSSRMNASISRRIAASKSFSA